MKGEQKQQLCVDLEHKASMLVGTFLGLGNGDLYFSPLTAANFSVTLAALSLVLQPAQSLFPQKFAA